MAPLSQMDPECCPKWRKLPEEKKGSSVWVTAHVLHHNLLRHRPPFTESRLAQLAGCTKREARDVLTEAVRLEWFGIIPAVPATPAVEGELVGQRGAPAYYISPVKPK